SVRKHFLDKLFVGSPVEGLAQQDEPQRRRIYRTVIRTERHLPCARHLAFAVLVEDLSRIFIAPIIFLFSLIPCQHAQRLAGKLRIQQKRLVSSDDGIASKHGREPGNSGSDDVLLAFGNLQGMQITQAGVYHLVENAVVGFNTRRLRLPVSKGLAARAQAAAEIYAAAGTRALRFRQRGDSSLDLETLEGRQLQLPACRGAINGFRVWRKMDDGLAGDVISTAIMEHQ